MSGAKPSRARKTPDRTPRRPGGRSRRGKAGRGKGMSGGWRGGLAAGVLLTALAGGTGLLFGYHLGGADGGGPTAVPVVAGPVPAPPPVEPAPEPAMVAAPRPGPPPAPSAPPRSTTLPPRQAGAAPPAAAPAAAAPAQVPPRTAEEDRQVATMPPAPPPPAAPAIPVVARPPQPLADDRGRPAWKRFAVPSTPPDGRPSIAVVIDDMGVDRRRSARIVALPGPLTLSWLPYAQDLTRQTGAARAAGHELMVHLPMEPVGGADPGPNAMLTSLGPEELGRRLSAGLGAFEGYVGVNNHMGSRFTQDAAGMKVVLEELERRGLLFLDSRTSGKSVGYSMARGLKMAAAGRDVFLDHDMTPSAIRASLDKLEQVARRQGHAVAIGHPHDATAQALAEWLPTLAGKGLALVPISALVQAQMPGL